MLLVHALLLSSLQAPAVLAALRPINEVVAVGELVRVAGRYWVPKEWRRSLVDESGRKRFDLFLRPLVAVEGGTVAIEVGVSRPGSEHNLLGERPGYDEVCHCYPDKESVLTVEEFAKGVQGSKRGRFRSFAIPSSTNVIQIELLEVALGHGEGACDLCPVIDRLRARVRVVAK